jgi:hypothetical protein
LPAVIRRLRPFYPHMDLLEFPNVYKLRRVAWTT